MFFLAGGLLFFASPTGIDRHDLHQLDGIVSKTYIMCEKYFRENASDSLRYRNHASDSLRYRNLTNSKIGMRTEGHGWRSRGSGVPQFVFQIMRTPAQGPGDHSTCALPAGRRQDAEPKWREHPAPDGELEAPPTITQLCSPTALRRGGSAHNRPPTLRRFSRIKSVRSVNQSLRRWRSNAGGLRQQ